MYVVHLLYMKANNIHVTQIWPNRKKLQPVYEVDINLFREKDPNV